MAKKITLDSEECIGCQSCVEICPKVFAFNEDEDKAYVIDEDADDSDGCAEEAAGACPVGCITVDE